MMDTKEALKELEDLTVDYGDRNEEQIARLDEAIDMAMDALRAQADGDTISRKGTIEAIQQHFNPTGEELPTELASVLAGVGVVIGTMPPAQPETHEERTETHACDLIDRQAAIDTLDKHLRTTDVPVSYPGIISALTEWLNELPSAQPEVLACGEGELIAQPEIVRCKDCKHWKDSDGVYRRGIGAESKCPVNIRAVYEGNFYCADAERRTDDS